MIRFSFKRAFTKNEKSFWCTIAGVLVHVRIHRTNAMRGRRRTTSVLLATRCTERLAGGREANGCQNEGKQKMDNVVLRKNPGGFNCSAADIDKSGQEVAKIRLQLGNSHLMPEEEETVSLFSLSSQHLAWLLKAVYWDPDGGSPPLTFIRFRWDFGNSNDGKHAKVDHLHCRCSTITLRRETAHGGLSKWTFTFESPPPSFGFKIL